MEDVIKKKVWSTKDVVIVIMVTASIVFSSTIIWTRFLFNEKQIELLSERADKRYSRQATNDQNQWDAINKLMETHSKNE